MSAADNASSRTTRAENAPNHDQTAAGLSEHLMNQSTHGRPKVSDNHRLTTKFDITSKKGGVYHEPIIHDETAELLNALLRKNHNNHHVYFSDTGGFHNHLTHHLLSTYALGATPDELQFAYDIMDSWQRPRFTIDEDTISGMNDPVVFKSMLGDDHHFHDYLAFFSHKFEKEGWKNVVTEFLFSRTPLADDLFVRLYAGIWHNLILLGYGVEFEQPDIVAEGLAGACVHSNAFGPYILECERIASKSSEPCRPLVDLLQNIRTNPALVNKNHWHGGNSFAYDDNVTSNAPIGMADLASQWKVDKPEDLTYRTAEMINVNAFVAGAAQRPDKVVKIDFIFVHHVNASIFFSAFLQQDWVANGVKIRLLETYTRMTLLTYAAGLGPELLANEIADYKPLEAGSTWSSIVQRSFRLRDDGHVSKLIRALAHGERVSRPWEKEDADMPSLPMKGGMWLQVANMAIDSTETEPNIGKRFVRGAGSDEAWAEFPDRQDS